MNPSPYRRPRPRVDDPRWTLVQAWTNDDSTFACQTFKLVEADGYHHYRVSAMAKTEQPSEMSAT